MKLSEHSSLLQKQVEETDARIEKWVKWCGCEPYGEMLVDGRQLEEYSYVTLLCARLLRFFVVFMVCACVSGLIVSLAFEILEGPVKGAPMQVQVQERATLQMPKVALCPPWGKVFSDDLTKVKAELVSIPSGGVQALSNFTRTECPEPQCTCFDFSSVQVKSSRVQYVRLEFSAADPEGEFGFGFFSARNDPSQSWSYARLGTETTGDLSVDVTKTESHSSQRFTFATTEPGVANVDGRLTSLVFGYNEFVEYGREIPSNAWTIAKAIAIFITLCAAVNNFKLFDLCFTPKVDDDEPAQLEPAPCLATIFGKCFPCCLPRVTTRNHFRRASFRPSMVQGRGSLKLQASSSDSEDV